MQKSKSKIKKGKTFQHICKGKDDDVFWLCYGKKRIFGKLPIEFIASLLIAFTFFLVKALRQWRQIQEAMKR
jgi:hypothetical protein